MPLVASHIVVSNIITVNTVVPLCPAMHCLSQSCTISASTQGNSDICTEISDDLQSRVPWINVHNEEQLTQRCPLSQAVADLNPNKPWTALSGRHKEIRGLWSWVVDNFGEQIPHITYTPYSSTAFCFLEQELLEQ